MGAETAAQLRAIPSLTGVPPDLDLARLPKEPVTLFLGWLAVVVERGVPEPHAMTLATVDPAGLPDARTLILKDVDERGWAFAGPASSAKGSQLASRAVAALDLWWQPIARAVRVRGSVVRATPEESAADLAARSPAARDGMAPGDWTLWRVLPATVEFWQGSPDRRHTRVVYRRSGDGWMLSVTRGGQQVVVRP